MDPGLQPHGTRAWLWLRWLLGLAIFMSVVVWVVKEGSFLQRLNLQVIVWSSVCSLLTSALHALTLQFVARTYGRALDYRQALRIAALGSLGNAAGGLPLGTAAKFAILHQRVGLSVGQITFGLAAVTVGISLWLLVYCAVSAFQVELDPGFRLVPAAGLALGGVAVAAGLRWASTRSRYSALVAPWLRLDRLAAAAGLSLLVASSFVLNFCTVGVLLLPGSRIPELVFVCASGTLLGLVSLLQAVAGVNELAMALMAVSVGIQATEGAQIALSLRATALAASGLILALNYLRRR